MKIKSIKYWELSQTINFIFVIVIIIAIGVFFRFINIDKKIYWDDETTTSLRISGYTNTDLLNQVFNGTIIDSKDLQTYQHPNTNKSLIDTINSLAVEDPHHPPLYYIMVRFWSQCFGSSVATIRTLSVMISLLIFPSIYWLCLELFESPIIGYVAMALIAISPFHLLYAQEAREYSLWTVTILLSSAALLRTMRVNTMFTWGIYVITLALGLYTDLFSIFVAIAQGIYVIINERFRFSKRLFAFLLSSVIGVLTFIPWLLVIMNSSEQLRSSTDWLSQKLNLLSLIERWYHNIIIIFVDLNSSQIDMYLFPILILVGYSIYFLIRRTPIRIWLFILTLILVTFLALALPDLIWGGRRSTIERYLIPCYLGIQIVVAFLLANKTTSLSVKNYNPKIWRFVMIALISSGILSCTIISQKETWWNKGPASIYLKVTPIIAQAHHPLLIGNIYDLLPGRHLALSYLLDTKVQLLFVSKSNISKIKIPNGFSDIFVFDPFKKLLYQLEKLQKYKLEPVYKGNTKIWLWRAKKIDSSV